MRCLQEKQSSKDENKALSGAWGARIQQLLITEPLGWQVSRSFRHVLPAGTKDDTAAMMGGQTLRDSIARTYWLIGTN
jgi:hypothetical protein